MKEHIKYHCPFSKVQCPYSECKQIFERSTIQYHLDHDCTHRPTKCPKCHVVISIKNIANHEENDCPFRQIACPFCFQLFDKDIFTAEHSQELGCPKKPIFCTMEVLGCPWEGIVESLNLHLADCLYFKFQDFIKNQNQLKKYFELNIQQMKDFQDNWVHGVEAKYFGLEEWIKSTNQQLILANNKIICLENQITLLLNEKKYLNTELNFIKKSFIDIYYEMFQSSESQSSNRTLFDGPKIDLDKKDPSLNDKMAQLFKNLSLSFPNDERSSTNMTFPFSFKGMMNEEKNIQENELIMEENQNLPLSSTLLTKKLNGTKTLTSKEELMSPTNIFPCNMTSMKLNLSSL